VAATGALEPLPHVFPFRFVETTLEPLSADGAGSVRVVVSTDARALRGLEALPLPVAVEMMAQAALLLQGGDPEVGRSGFLAALGRVRLRGVVRPGDELVARVRITARLGPLVRFSARLERGRRLVASAEISVKTGEARV